MRPHLFLLVLVACSGSNGANKGTDSGNPVPDTWASVLSENIDGGIFLSGWEGADGNLVIVGGDIGTDQGRIGRRDGSDLCVEDGVTDATLWWIDGHDNEWYATGTKGAVLHSSGDTRTRVDVPTNATLLGVYYDGADVWVAGGDTNTARGEIWRMAPGQDWEQVATDLPALIFKAWNGWFIGDGIAYYWNGSELEERHPPGGQRLLTMHGPSADDAYAVGGFTGPAVLRWSDGAWTELPADNDCLHAQLSGVWVDPQGTAWVAGHNGTAASYDGTSWTCDLPPITVEHFHGVLGYQQQVVWMGGNLLSTSGNYGTIGVHPAVAPLSEVPTCN